MPRGDKSKYTDKQDRKAEHVAEATRSAAFPKRKPNAGPGPRSTRTMAAARRKVGQAEAERPAIPPPIKAAKRAGRPPLPDRAQVDRPPPKRRRRRASTMPSITRTVEFAR
jgi:hypothetical protein